MTNAPNKHNQYILKNADLPTPLLLFIPATAENLVERHTVFEKRQT